ncbi:MutS-related protein [Candidatus Methanosphaera massiliense]|jgi:DNA mismatch repair protein MutS2|uniref:MutS-related protein n=1 Tax=Methanosphaera TaxID=2316 RepID=UPI0023806306|nr:helix-hairpin-helix domain-containing protein [Candidatus Methanosphaera massiliense]MDE4078309.1 AAA family ATPase [Candidatus Methanosphaera massiliense]
MEYEGGLFIEQIDEIKGIGSKIINKIIQTYGSYDNFIESIKNYDIDKLMSISGLSQKKALEIVRYIHGYREDEFLKTEQSQNLYNDIIKRILEFANTDYARNRVLLLTPTTDYNKIKQTNQLIQDTLDHTQELDYHYIRALYEKIHPLNKNIRPKFHDEYAIVCEDYDDYLSLIKKGFDRYTNIYPLKDNVNFNEYEFIVYLYNDFNMDPGDATNIVTISNSSPDHEIQPNILLEYFKQNRDTLENVCQLRQYLGLETCIDEVLDVLDNIKIENKNKIALDETIEEIKDHANDTINQQIKNIELEGDEVLQLLNHDGNLPPKIMTIFNDVLDEAREKLGNKTGLLFDPFIIKYPLEIDYNEVRRIQEKTIANIHLKEYEQELTACNILEKYEKQIEDETIELIHYDYQFTLASFTKFYDLTIPEIGDEYKLEGALHLSLKQQEKINNIPIQKINYHLDKDNNIILLTGANSGGKTTLLETLGQHTIMTHMGLGVCSEKATIPKTNEVHYFTKKHSLNAGAFETFLTSFIPVTIGKEKKLILIDELESITELEAAVKIIIGFIEHIQDENSYAVIVTHMAPEILKRTENIKIRTDGIEAKGLDKEYNLIVDRSPKINYLANSTPELILKKIYEKSEEPLKSVYKDILDKF